MPRILVVDDAPVDRTLAGALLTSVPTWQVLYAVDGQHAIEQMAQEVPDLVLTDLHMPRVDGLQLLEVVRGQFPMVPVVLMTHYGGEELAVKAIERGAASYVPKSAMGKLLRQTVCRVLSLSHESTVHDLAMRSCTRHEEFELDNDPGYIDFLANYFRKSVVEIWQDESRPGVRIGVAVAEALSNSLYHGNLELSSDLRITDSDLFYRMALARSREAPFSDRRLRVTCNISARVASFTICDQGRGFDHENLPDPTADDWLERPSGRGILLMRSFMDEVDYHDHGRQVVLVKHRDVVPADKSSEATSPVLYSS